jgi:hypothetical protein
MADVDHFMFTHQSALVDALIRHWLDKHLPARAVARPAV